MKSPYVEKDVNWGGFLAVKGGVSREKVKGGNGTQLDGSET